MSSTSSRKRVTYYYDSNIGAYSYGLGHPMKPARMRITHDLVEAYGMLDRMHVLRPTRATPQGMTAFHTDEYIHFLNRVTPETAEDLTYHGTRFLIGEDNPPFEGVFEFASISAGGTLAAADRIASGSADIAINWGGGLHHAKKQEASGFCYINDINLGILELLRSYPRVLYIDIDCHHGDGVEEAFYSTDRVMTLSFHKYGEFFPGTGTLDDIGYGKGKGYAVNVPLKDGLTDESFQSMFEPIVTKIMEKYLPSVVVLQCGADSLAGDKLGCFNLTMRGHASCVQFLRAYDVPLILLGGGGYTVKNVVRTWAFETACALGIENDIEEMLPWNDFYEWFGPRYRLEVLANNMEDENLREGPSNLEKIKVRVMQQLAELPCAPSVQMQDVPGESLAKHLKVPTAKVAEEVEEDELDEALAQHAKYVYDLQSHEEPVASDASEDSDASSVYSGYGSSRRRSQRQTRTHQQKQKEPTRKRMSLLTGEYFDIPALDAPEYAHFDFLPGRTAKRRFFQSAGDSSRNVVVDDLSGGWDRRMNVRVNGTGDLHQKMTRGGRDDAGAGMDMDEDVDINGLDAAED